MIFSGRPIVQVAKELGLSDGSLGNWVREWKEDHPEAGAKDFGPVEWTKNEALPTENAELQREIEFLGYPDVRIQSMVSGWCWSGQGLIKKVFGTIRFVG